jgi:ADP-heptose:LPS heptosyltransferase
MSSSTLSHTSAHILIYENWGIGDSVLITPLLRALREVHPAAKITLAYGSAASLEIVPAHLYDAALRLKPAELSIPQVFATFLSLRKQRFTAALLCSGHSYQAARLLRWVTGVPVVVGDGHRRPRFAYTHFQRRNKSQHRIEANLTILRTLYPHAPALRPLLNLDPSNLTAAQNLWQQNGFHSCEVLGLHPGADNKHGKVKRPPQALLRSTLALYLATDPNRRVAVFLGPDELNWDRKALGNDPRIHYFTRLPLGVVAALIAKCHKFLAGDSGLGHIAAALDVPGITVAGPSSMPRYRPRSRSHRIVQTDNPPSCMPCAGTALYANCPHEQRCLQDIKAEKLAAAL